MPHTEKQKETSWYNVNTVVEILIHETPRGEKYAPYIGNLCIGFTALTLPRLEEELNDMRTCWPFIFPRTLTTEAMLRMIAKKYMDYEEILALRDE